jgi:hypothetical protein
MPIILYSLRFIGDIHKNDCLFSDLMNEYFFVNLMLYHALKFCAKMMNGLEKGCGKVWITPSHM